MVYSRTLLSIVLLLGIATTPFASVHADDENDSEVEKAFPDPPKPTLEELADEVSRDAQRMHTDSALGRKESLQALRKVIADYPGTNAARDAALQARILEQMVKEDEDLARLPADKDLPRSERVERLIFRLRDKVGDVTFTDPPGAVEGPDDNPAVKLVKLGYEAVPALLEHFADERPAGTDVVFVNDRGSFRKLNVYFGSSTGDYAQAILMTIIGSDLGSELDARKDSAFAKKARAWWELFQREGESAMLMRGTEAGDGNSTIQARRLINRYPGSAEVSIRCGLRHASEPDIRLCLLKMLARFLDRREKERLSAVRTIGMGELTVDQSALLLEEEMKEPTLETRWFAAAELIRRGYPQGSRALIHDWKERPAASDDGKLIDYLVRSHDVQAIQALGVGLRDRTWAERQSVIDRIGRERVNGGDSTPPIVRAAMESILIAALDDSKDTMNVVMSGGTGPPSSYAERICDVAARYLAAIEHVEAPIEWSDSFEERDRKILRLREKLRKRQSGSLKPERDSKR